MSRPVVIHHALHPNEGEEGIYRLIYAEETEQERVTEEPNPDYDPERTQPTVLEEHDEDYELPNPNHDPDNPSSPPAFLMSRRVAEEVPNPDYDPDHSPVIRHVERFRAHVNHQEIVWCAGDPKWQGRDPDDIAAEQLQIVRDALTRQAAEQERAEAEAARQSVAHHLGTEGHPL